MKADLAAIVVISVVAAAFGGMYVQKMMEEELSEDARYERDLDAMVDSRLEAAGLDFLPEALSPHGSARLAVLRALYTDPEQREQLNYGIAAVRSDWSTSYALFAEQAGRAYEDGRLEAEIDERMGEGAYALMVNRYEASLEHGPPPPVERRASHWRECERTARELRAYVICNTPDGRYTVDGRR